MIVAFASSDDVAIVLAQVSQVWRPQVVLGSGARHLAATASLVPGLPARQWLGLAHLASMVGRVQRARFKGLAA